MSRYSTTEKILHKLYLSNYFISKASLEMENILYGSKVKTLEVKEYVFITGLARSGTTAVMRHIFQTGEYASLQYSNMPMLLAPNLWNKEVKIEKHERAHKDGILVDGNSPEEFDEYFWKVFLQDSYIQEGLLLHEIDKITLEKYLNYVSLICLSKKKEKYISKNNNNILRLNSLSQMKGAKLIVLFRDPISHASSLMKLHHTFSENQKEDPFVLDYFNFLGHHEFGLGHKPFLLTEKFMVDRKEFSKDTLEYWLLVWINYYNYLLTTYKSTYILVSFEDLINIPNNVFAYIYKNLSATSNIQGTKRHTPADYPDVPCDIELLAEAREIYKKLDGLKNY